MASFQAPSNASGVPPVLPEGDPSQTTGAFRLMRYYSSRPEGINVYYRVTNGVGTVTEIDPQTTYDANGLPLVDGWSDIVEVWWGGHAPSTVTDYQAGVLRAAGYTVLGDPLYDPSGPALTDQASVALYTQGA